jgi:hypothetical protein
MLGILAPSLFSHQHGLDLHDFAARHENVARLVTHLLSQ